MSMASVELKNGMLLYRTPYHAGLVAALKTAVPATARRWEPNEKLWLVDPAFGNALQQVTAQVLGERLTLPALTGAVCNAVTTVLDLRYLGRVKSREDGSESAFGWTNGGWNSIWPKSVLYDWFGVTARPGEATTLYARLGVSHDTPGAEIKKAFRRLARQWHPDVCREPDARAQFEAIKAAYDLLSDPMRRGKYDAGLALEAIWRQVEADKQSMAAQVSEWAPPLRCGYVLASARSILGRHVVEQILAWEDITNAAGQVLVSSWQAGADKFTESWVMA